MPGLLLERGLEGLEIVQRPGTMDFLVERFPVAEGELLDERPIDALPALESALVPVEIGGVAHPGENGEEGDAGQGRGQNEDERQPELIAQASGSSRKTSACRRTTTASSAWWTAGSIAVPTRSRMRSTATSGGIFSW